MKFSAIITAGGTSSRYGKTNKLLEKIHSKEVINYTLDAFLSIDEIQEIIISANSTIIKDLEELFQDISKIKIIEGGQTRQESVYKGLLACSNPDYVLIHDGARPMISIQMIGKAIKAVQSKKALTVATKTVDTIKLVDENLKILKTIDRTFLYNTQTPQAFEYKLILDAHKNLKDQKFTDDAGMLEALGNDVYVLDGEYRNIKITTKADLAIAEIYLNPES